MAHYMAGSREEWEAANSTQLEREKELDRLSEELTRERRHDEYLELAAAHR